MPTISIVTSVYDAKEYLPLTVDSVLKQSFTDFELILVEDGSPNGCGALCDELAKKDSRIRVIHKPNGGPASALNAGWDAARGDYFACVDSDDLLHPDFLQTLYHAIQTNHCDIAACAAGCIDEAGQRISRSVTVEENLLGCHDSILQFYDILRSKSMYAMVVWNKLFSARLFEGVRHDETMFFGDDASIMDKIYANSSIVCSNEILYFYRERTGSQTAALFDPRALDDLRLYGKWIDFFAAKPDQKDLYYWSVARYWEVFYILYVHAMESNQMSDDVKQNFAKHKKKLNHLLGKILLNPHISAFEKFRAFLFVASPRFCYKSACFWGKLNAEKS